MAQPRATQKHLPDLLETFTIVTASTSDPVLEAVQYYSKTRQEGNRIGQDAPTDFVQEARWKRIVLDEDGKIKAGPWTLCLADKLWPSFRREVFRLREPGQYRSSNSDLMPLSA